MMARSCLRDAFGQPTGERQAEFQFAAIVFQGKRGFGLTHALAAVAEHGFRQLRLTALATCSNSLTNTMCWFEEWSDRNGGSRSRGYETFTWLTIGENVAGRSGVQRLVFAFKD